MNKIQKIVSITRNMFYPVIHLIAAKESLSHLYDTKISEYCSYHMSPHFAFWMTLAGHRWEQLAVMMGGLLCRLWVLLVVTRHYHLHLDSFSKGPLTWGSQPMASYIGKKFIAA